jgi:hypothetical protein
MRKLRAILWMTAAALLVIIVVVPAFGNYQSATADLSIEAQQRKTLIDNVEKTDAPAPKFRLTIDNLDKVIPNPKGAERQALILSAVGLTVWLMAQRLLRKRRLALRAASPLLFEAPRAIKHLGPILWNHDIEIMESIGPVGLLQPIALPVMRQQARMRELALAA